MHTSNAVCDSQDVSVVDFTGPELIIPHLAAMDKNGAIKELSQVLERAGRIRDILVFYHATLNYEYFHNTALEHGLAFPHARMSNLPELSFALGRSDAPLFWGSRATAPVRLVFLLAVPATDATEYLSLVAGLSRLGEEPRLLEKLLRASDTFEILNVLRQVKRRAFQSAMW